MAEDSGVVRRVAGDSPPDIPDEACRLSFDLMLENLSPHDRQEVLWFVEFLRLVNTDRRAARAMYEARHGPLPQPPGEATGEASVVAEGATREAQ